MVVVEDSNSLVFYTSGTEYQGLLPLLEQLDVLPKQVVLDIVIAEVTLKDEFRFGFEWALQNSEVSLTTLGAFGASSIGGTALAINGSDGEIVSQLLQTSQLVNVLSNPTMLVKDGVTANINVGSDISVVGSTTFDPINGQRQTTASVYRKTGVDVTVTPTINAKGVVLMDVEKSISNAVPNSTGAGGNPDVFERSIKTEVVAASGQTVLLGGLISEDISASGSGTPGISSLPLLGWLFKAEGDSGTRTELVMLVTARIIDDLQQWEELESRFSDGLRYLDLSGE
jgi:general secretion pathway protein D